MHIPYHSILHTLTWRLNHLMQNLHTSLRKITTKVKTHKDNPLNCNDIQSFFSYFLSGIKYAVLLKVVYHIL